MFEKVHQQRQQTRVTPSYPFTNYRDKEHFINKYKLHMSRVASLLSLAKLMKPCVFYLINVCISKSGMT